MAHHSRCHHKTGAYPEGATDLDLGGQVKLHREGHKRAKSSKRTESEEGRGEEWQVEMGEGAGMFQVELNLQRRREMRNLLKR